MFGLGAAEIVILALVLFAGAAVVYGLIRMFARAAKR